MENSPNIKITELYLVKADWNRTFMGQIIREKDNDGNEIIRGNVIVNDGKMWSIGNTEEEIGKNLDELCTMKLDKHLHDNTGRNEEIAGTPFYLN